MGAATAAQAAVRYPGGNGYATKAICVTVMNAAATYGGKIPMTPPGCFKPDVEHGWYWVSLNN